MGCDIHGVIEVHIDGKWSTALSLADISPRNYGLFALLFGVRGDSPYEYKYRGFPKDIAWYSEFEFCAECEGSGHDEASLEMKERFHKYHPDEKECQHCCDWHSVSWITWQEVERHWDEIIAVISGRLPDPEWKFVFDTMRFWASYLPEEVKVTDNGTTGYVIDYRESFSPERARNNVAFVAYDRLNNRWIETARVPR